MVDLLPVTANMRLDELIRVFGPNIEISKDLAPLTSYKTGGCARYFISVRSEHEALRAVNGARKLGLTFFLIGGGSNLLVSDDGFDGLIIKINLMDIELIEPDQISVGAGEELSDLVAFATSKSLSGIEFLAGIWGSVGGAIYGNAGAFGGEISDPLSEISLIDSEGNLKAVKPEYLSFGYRDSILKQSGEIVVRAKLKLESAEQSVVAARVEEILKMRDGKHPGVGENSAGCFFKNIPDPSQPHGKMAAGKLLEEAGVKNLSVGGAKVFDKHANIIVNKGDATSKDIRMLADIMKVRVKEKFNIELTEEVIQIGNL